MFVVVYHPEVVAKDIPRLNRDLKDRIRRAIESRLTRAPQDYGKPLAGTLRPLWRLRVGDYRVVYAMEGRRIKVLLIAHRKEAYAAGIPEARKRGWLK